MLDSESEKHINLRTDSQSGRQVLVTVFKGIAICLVILVHSAQSFSLPEWAKYIPRFGQMGCQMFFVLSAYTLCLSIDNKNTNFLSFMKRRYLRIIPGYWSMIFVYLLLGGLSTLIFSSNVFGTSNNPFDLVANFLLLNGLTPGLANNEVVRGGWYVGTSIVFYALTPLLFKVFSSNIVWWRRNRFWAFPLFISIITSSFVIILGCYDERFICKNNNFVYFSFINQLPSYAIGFSLFSWKKANRKSNKILTATIGLICLFGTMFLFFSQIEYAFAFVPTLFSIFFGCLFIFTYECLERNQSSCKCFLSLLLQKFGEYSFAIYLIHSIVVYECARVALRVFNKLPIALPEIIIYLLWLPIAYSIIYFVGKIFTRYLNFMNRQI